MHRSEVCSAPSFTVHRFPHCVDRFSADEERNIWREDILAHTAHSVQYLFKQMHTLRVAERQGEGVSCTCCECLGAQRCHWCGGRHGNPPHLSATAAERSRGTHTHHMNACTHTCAHIFPPRHLSVTSLSPLSSSPLVCLPSSHSCLRFLLTSLFIRLFSPLNSTLFCPLLLPLLILFSSSCFALPFLSSSSCLHPGVHASLIPSHM